MIRVLLALLPGAWAETPLTTEQVVAAMMEADQSRAALLRGYTSVRVYSMENKRFGARAAMTVRLTYRHPGQKQFELVEESGSATVRKKVFRRMLDTEMEASSDQMRAATQITANNYQFRLVGSDHVDGRRAYVLEAVPRTKSKFLFHGKVWVDAEDFAVARIEGSPAQKPSIWVRKTSFVHRYQKVGPFWLALANRSDTDVVVFGHTQVRIEYSGYQINRQQPESGLTDR